MSNETPVINVEVKRLGDEKVNRSLLKTATAIILFPWTLCKMMYNTYLVVRHLELRYPLQKNICPMQKISQFSSFIFTSKVTSNPAVMSEILKYPRKDPEIGLFNDIENEKVWVPVLQDLYPDEVVTADDYILTCHKDKIHLYRQSILEFIGLKKIAAHTESLQRMIEQNLASWEEQQKLDGKIDLTEATLVFSTHVISKLLLGHPGPFEKYRNISRALTYLNSYMLKKTWRQPISEQEKIQYSESLDTVRDAIAISLSAIERPDMGSLVDLLRDTKGMTSIQSKSTLLIMYFAGAETSASLLNYTLWQLGQHPEYQEKIYSEMPAHEDSLFQLSTIPSIEKLFTECIRLFTPAYVIGRQLADDLVCTIKDETGKVLLKEKILKKHGIILAPTFAARDPLTYTAPDAFNPDRFDAIPKKLPWLPFGDGKHACPGQWLAKMEIAMLIAGLVKKYRITSSPEGEVAQKGFLTLKLLAETGLILIPRDQEPA